jgi:DNA primase
LKQSKTGNFHCCNTQSHSNEDESASLSISNELGLFKCWGCLEKGNWYQLIKWLTDEEPLSYMENALGITINQPNKKGRKK